MRPSLPRVPFTTSRAEPALRAGGIYGGVCVFLGIVRLMLQTSPSFRRTGESTYHVLKIESVFRLG